LEIKVLSNLLGLFEELQFDRKFQKQNRNSEVIWKCVVIRN